MATRQQLEGRRSLHYRNALEAKDARDWPEYFSQLKLVAQIDRAIARLGAE
jgi:hypothetical protein